MNITGYDSTLQFQVYGPAEIPNTAEFTAHVRTKTAGSYSGTTLLATLTSADSTITVVSSEANPNPTTDREWITTFELLFEGDTTEAWTDEEVITDFVRTDGGSEEYMGFKLVIPFHTPVTRGL